MLRALARYCRYRNVAILEEDRLREAIAPTSLTVRESGSTVPAAGTAWKDSVDLAIELGIAERREGLLSFDEQLIAELASDGVPGFRRALRRIVLAPENNDGLWEHGEGERWSSEGAREFSRIAVWLLETDSRGLVRDKAYETARRLVGGPAKLVENVEQWRVFVRWAEALGVISGVSNLHLPDPTVAVEEELVDVFSSEAELPALRVRDEVSGQLPVLRNGEYAEGLQRFLIEKPRRLDAEAGPALSFALMRLKRRGLILFDRRSDADQLILRDPHSDENPTHILWKGRPE